MKPSLALLLLAVAGCPRAGERGPGARPAAADSAPCERLEPADAAPRALEPGGVDSGSPDEAEGVACGPLGEPGAPFRCFLVADIGALLEGGRRGVASFREYGGTEVNLALTRDFFAAACEQGSKAGCDGVLQTLELWGGAANDFCWQSVHGAPPRTREHLTAVSRRACPRAPGREGCEALRPQGRFGMGGGKGPAPCWLACALVQPPAPRE
jgi:hypothetical protein